MRKSYMELNPAQETGAPADLRKALSDRIIGQDEAISSIVPVITRAMAGLQDPGRPLASFLLLGPTGSGKTKTVEALAEVMSGNERSVIRIDCAEYQHSHDIAKLVGSPPGYLGHRETQALLTQERLNASHNQNCKISFVLFDEIEKASDSLWNLLLGILDKATLTLGTNQVVKFNNSLIFLTSNLGAEKIQSILKPSMGFQGRKIEESGKEDLNKMISGAGVKAARKRFSPEFFNRLTKVISYRPLDKEDLSKILNLELYNIQKRLFSQLGTNSFVFTLTEPAREKLLTSGYQPELGARPLKRVVEKELLDSFANLLVTEQISRGDFIQVDYRDGYQFTRRLAELEDRQLIGAAEMALASNYLMTDTFELPPPKSEEAAASVETHEAGAAAEENSVPKKKKSKKAY